MSYPNKSHDTPQRGPSAEHSTTPDPVPWHRYPPQAHSAQALADMQDMSPFRARRHRSVLPSINVNIPSPSLSVSSLLAAGGGSSGAGDSTHVPDSLVPPRSSSNNMQCAAYAGHAGESTSPLPRLTSSQTAVAATAPIDIPNRPGATGFTVSPAPFDDFASTLGAALPSSYDSDFAPAAYDALRTRSPDTNANHHHQEADYSDNDYSVSYLSSSGDDNDNDIENAPPPPSPSSSLLMERYFPSQPLRNKTSFEPGKPDTISVPHDYRRGLLPHEQSTVSAPPGGTERLRKLSMVDEGAASLARRPAQRGRGNSTGSGTTVRPQRLNKAKPRLTID